MMSFTKGTKKKYKNTSYFSHDYIIANHGDIVSFIAMVIVIGLMFQVTAPVSKLFIMLQHNVTIRSNQASLQDTVNRVGTLYTAGYRDLLTCLFYTLIAIVIHAVVQEYIIDRLYKRLHFSKSQYGKVSEISQLLLFYLISFLWGSNIVYKERLLASISTLWTGYPHLYLSFWFKFYFICQICYWLHCFPELYFQRVSPSEMPERAQRYAINLLCIAGAYLLNLNRIAVVLLVLHYLAEIIFHCSRLLRLAGRRSEAWYGFALWDLVFVAVRLFSVALAGLTFALGLEKNSRDRISIREGNFNTKFIRLNCLAVVCLLQGYLMWNFITFHVRKARQFLETHTDVQQVVSHERCLTRSIGQDNKPSAARLSAVLEDRQSNSREPTAVKCTSGLNRCSELRQRRMVQ
ncbi:hypothetical protein BOX15_Mlig028829g2 [Macrostomum lignano]|uniref:TLC domain-containing protein n=1 Tax=Macrostomum lignano TaxID=282301 RepID=A0A267DTF6_9PLAT|nr:hypothetical protein BOX15_Mlig028829g2 [Macrostomum lignano]